MKLRNSITNKLVFTYKIFLLITLFLPANTNPAKTPQDYITFCKKGKSTLQSGKLDSAKYYFFMAYKSGMPAESLYYFLSETYVANYAFDSALALNYAIGETGEKAFRTRILKQRYLIYSGLEWEKEARSVLDSMKSLTLYKASALIPELYLNIGTGYKYEKQTVDTV